MLNKPYSFRQLIANVDKLNNKVAVVPTDTTIGLVSKSQSLIYQIKKRSARKPLIMFIDSFKKIKNLTPIEINILKKYWPGKLTIIKDKCSYRVPKSRKLIKLVKKTGPLYSSSANISSKQPIKNTIDAFTEFEHNLDKIFVVKGKQHSPYPSTIVDFDNLTVVRCGIVDGRQIIKTLKQRIE